MDPLVTIVTPCYNAEKTISETIESVLSQTYKNWEMLIIDDGSTDNSQTLVNNYILKDNRIKYLQTTHPTGSPSEPRNIGIENARGEYIAFLDSDDKWLPNKLEKQMQFIDENHYDLVYSYYEKISWDGARDSRIVKTRKVTRYCDLLKSNSIPCLTSVISRRAIGETRFKQIPQEDFCFWLDILKKGYVAHNLCEVTAFYREAKSSRSANKIDMFKGYWNVIRNHQNIGFLESSCYMVTYSILGLAKYLK